MFLSIFVQTNLGEILYSEHGESDYFLYSIVFFLFLPLRQNRLQKWIVPADKYILKDHSNSW